MKNRLDTGGRANSVCKDRQTGAQLIGPQPKMHGISSFESQEKDKKTLRRKYNNQCRLACFSASAYGLLMHPFSRPGDLPRAVYF